jgi:hypothetical protein
MSVTTERVRIPEIRTAPRATQRRGGWAIVAIALLIAAGAAALLLWPQQATEPAAGRVGAAAEQAAQIWSVKAAQAPFFASQGRAGVSAPSKGETSEAPSTSTTISEAWAAKAAYGRSLQAAPATSATSEAPSTSATTTIADWATKAAYGRSLQEFGNTQR